jgi:hypothetical protein
MGTWGYFKIESEIKDKIDLKNGQFFDNTPSRIFRVEPEMYQEEFEKLVLEFGKPINTNEEFDDFEIWLIKDKQMNVTTADFNFIENYTALKGHEK